MTILDGAPVPPPSFRRLNACYPPKKTPTVCANTHNRRHASRTFGPCFRALRTCWRSGRTDGDRAGLGLGNTAHGLSSCARLARSTVSLVVCQTHGRTRNNRYPLLRPFAPAQTPVWLCPPVPQFSTITFDLALVVEHCPPAATLLWGHSGSALQQVLACWRGVGYSNPKDTGVIAD